MTLAKALSSRKGRTAFVPFLVAGDPSLAVTARSIKALEAAGADIVELGVPFSDPVADGPVIQAAAERALKNGTTLTKVLAMAKALRKQGVKVPFILFTYLNLAWRLGPERFAKALEDAGIEGALLVDLPAESCGPWRAALKARRRELVLLAAPTTNDARLQAIGRASGSVVYYVSREGVTGARAGLPPDIAARLKKVRAAVGKPLLVGFGVATREQARGLAPHADAVVVGSALVAAGARSGENGVRRLAAEIVHGLGENRC